MHISQLDITNIRSLPIFQGLSQAEVEAILSESQVRRVPEGSFFFQQEDAAEHTYLLAKGQVKLLQVTADGQQVILNVISPYQVFGLVAFTPGNIYSASAQAAVDCEAYSWTQEQLSRLSRRYPQLALNAIQVMAARVKEFQGQISTLSTERVERRLARAILRLANQVGRKVEDGVLIDMTVTRQDLAEMSGTTLFTVSRILSQWERQGLIDSGRERVLVRRPHGLVVIAEDLPV